MCNCYSDNFSFTCFYVAFLCDCNRWTSSNAKLFSWCFYGVVNFAIIYFSKVRIDVAAAGVNFGDLLMIVGQYQVKLPTPFVPGSEMSGMQL